MVVCWRERLAPGVVHACACGCNVFDVATSSMLPNGQGGMAWLQYDYQDQNRNWNGTSEAPAADNTDKEIETHFITAGLQYLFNDQWGARWKCRMITAIYPSDDKIQAFQALAIIVSRNWGAARRYPYRRNLYRVLPGLIGRFDVWPEIADRQLQ